MMRRGLLATGLSLFLLLFRVHGFGIVVSPAVRQASSTTKLLSLTEDTDTAATAPALTPISQRFFQLEELEDKDKRLSEIFLNGDSSVTMGETDGPLYLSASGTWLQKTKEGGDKEGSFQMKLSFTYEAGKDKHLETDMGPFTFTVERIYTGGLTLVGAKTAVSGVIHQIDDVGGDREVGYFNMLDTTTERLVLDASSPSESQSAF